MIHDPRAAYAVDFVDAGFALYESRIFIRRDLTAPSRALSRLCCFCLRRHVTKLLTRRKCWGTPRQAPHSDSGSGLGLTAVHLNKTPAPSGETGGRAEYSGYAYQR
jgi:hypothetical protein